MEGRCSSTLFGFGLSTASPCRGLGEEKRARPALPAVEKNDRGERYGRASFPGADLGTRHEALRDRCCFWLSVFFPRRETRSCGADLESRTATRRVATRGAAATWSLLCPRNHLSSDSCLTFVFTNVGGSPVSMSARGACWRRRARRSGALLTTATSRVLDVELPPPPRRIALSRWR